MRPRRSDGSFRSAFRMPLLFRAGEGQSMHNLGIGVRISPTSYDDNVRLQGYLHDSKSMPKVRLHGHSPFAAIEAKAHLQRSRNARSYPQRVPEQKLASFHTMLNTMRRASLRLIRLYQGNVHTRVIPSTYRAKRHPSIRPQKQVVLGPKWRMVDHVPRKQLLMHAKMC